jgi:hypothetical protein
MIVSIRRAVSRLPLRAALAAVRRRLAPPPTCASTAFSDDACDRAPPARGLVTQFQIEIIKKHQRYCAA